MNDSPPFRFHRRDLLKLGFTVPLGLASLKTGIAVVLGSEHRPLDLADHFQFLSMHDAGVIRAASMAIIGSIGDAALANHHWHPALQADHFLSYLSEKERKLVSTGLKLFEHGALNLAGVSRWSIAERQQRLENWRESNLELKRSVWSFLHAVATTSYASCNEGWRWMNYEGPCRSDVGFPGRIPGQTAKFDWNPMVP